MARNIRRKDRQEQAQARQEERENRTDRQQIRRLVAAGHGHCKEVTRLEKRIEQSNKGNKNNG